MNGGAKQEVQGRPLQRDTETRMEEGNYAETWGRSSRQRIEVQRPWGGSMLDVSKEQRGPSVAAAEDSRGRGGLEARVDTLAFTLGKLEAIRGLGHWGGAFSLIALAAVLRIDLGPGQGCGQEAVAGER